MIKKICIYVFFCIILCNTAGCTENITPTLSTEEVSAALLIQSTNKSFADSSTPTQPFDDSSMSIQTKFKTPTNSGNYKMDNNCKLIVKSKDITFGNHVKLNYEYRYAELPLTAIMKELGAKVEWKDKTTAKISFGDKDYILDTAKGSLMEFGGTFNTLIVAPGSKHGIFYQVVGNEFIVDSDSAKMLIINIMDAKISIDYDEKTVSIG